MKTIDHWKRVGNITYTEFPVFDELAQLRPDAAQKVMTFFRMIGLGTPRQINEAIGEPNDSDRVECLLRRINVKVSVDEATSAENVREFEEYQKEILGEDTKAYTINVSDIVVEAQSIHYSLEKALRKLLAAHGFKGSTEPSKDSKFRKKLSEMAADTPEKSQWIIKRPTSQEPPKDNSSLRLSSRFLLGLPDMPTRRRGSAATSARPQAMAAKKAPERPTEKTTTVIPEQPQVTTPEQTPPEKVPEQLSEKAPEQPSEVTLGQPSEEDPEVVSKLAQAQELPKEKDPGVTPEPEPIQEGPPEAAAEPAEGSDEISKKVLDYAAACTIDARRGYMNRREVLNDKEYLRKLVEHFPLVSNEIIARYLFDGSITGIQVGNKIRAAGIKKQIGRRLGGSDNIRAIYQRASFVAWTNGDWRSYLDHALAHAKKDADPEAMEELNRATDDLAKHGQSTPPPCHFEAINKRADYVPATVETMKVLPGTKPIVYREGHFGATIDVSTTAGRAEIESLVMYIMTNMPNIKLDSYSIYPDE
ncbi:hypothetical protein IK146_01885 [Candidatus Saccharibacteria bacterium]|nr:hypothetical protein [Candidatus Saccharibacteria bacterium]